MRKSRQEKLQSIDTDMIMLFAHSYHDEQLEAINHIEAILNEQKERLQGLKEIGAFENTPKNATDDDNAQINKEGL